MMITVNGMRKNLSDERIAKYMKVLELTKEEAIQTYLEEEGWVKNEEYEAFNAKAAKVKIDHGAMSAEIVAKKMNTNSTPVEKKPRAKKTVAEKALIISTIAENICSAVDVMNVIVENAEKYIKFEKNGKHFTLNLVKNNKVKEDAPKPAKTGTGKVTRKPDGDKAEIIAAIADILNGLAVQNLAIENVEKIIKFEMNGLRFTLDLVKNNK